MCLPKPLADGNTGLIKVAIHIDENEKRSISSLFSLSWKKLVIMYTTVYY